MIVSSPGRGRWRRRSRTLGARFPFTQPFCLDSAAVSASIGGCCVAICRWRLVRCVDCGLKWWRAQVVVRGTEEGSFRRTLPCQHSHPAAMDSAESTAHWPVAFRARTAQWRSHLPWTVHLFSCATGCSSGSKNQRVYGWRQTKKGTGSKCRKIINFVSRLFHPWSVFVVANGGNVLDTAADAADADAVGS